MDAENPSQQTVYSSCLAPFHASAAPDKIARFWVGRRFGFRELKGMLIEIHPNNPEAKKVAQAVELLKKDGVIIIPTDSVYSFACALGSSKGLDKMARLRDLNPSEANFSLICENLSQVSQYVAPLSQPIFKLMKRALPGPFTFILNAGIKVPRIFRKSKKEVGIRLPDHNVPTAIIEILGRPLVVSSVLNDQEETEYMTDPGLVHERYRNQVEAVISGGLGNLEASTVMDCTGDAPVVIRAGRGKLEGLV